MKTQHLLQVLENNRRGAKTAGLSEHETKYEEALTEAHGLINSLQIAIDFIDGVGNARLKLGAGREGCDIILKQIC